MTSSIENVLEPWTLRTSSSGQIVLEKCPFCDARAHLYASISTGAWICFKCNKAGGIIMLFAELEGLTYAEAEIEIKNAGVRRTWRPIETDDRPVMIDPPKEFVPCHDSGRWRIPRYLTERRISKTTILDWGLGYCERGTYRGRIVIPFTTGGERSFTARAVSPTMQPRYLGPEVDEGHGRRFLPGWKFASKGDAVVICEGPFDAMRLYSAGLKPLALLGKAIGATQRKRIRELAPSRVTIMLDADAWESARAVAHELAPFVRDLRAVPLHDGDPDDHEEGELRELVSSATGIETAERDRILSKLSELTY
jgi:DNA primase